MKSLILPAILLISSFVPVFAMTDAEITPAALAGKTLTFTIQNAGGGFATTGSWTGTFGNPGFTVTNVTGNTANITTTHNIGVMNGYTVANIAKYIEGSGPTTIAFYVSDGIGHYEMNFYPMNNAFQIGTFVIGAPVAKAPEISVKLGTTTLKDAVGKTNFGKVKAKKSSTAKTITIKNTGTAKLTGLALAKSGTDAADFIVTKLSRTTLGPGASLTFKATFKPKVKGTKNAVIVIRSNDKDESRFDIKVTGVATK